jgi:hypothetical protein
MVKLLQDTCSEEALRVPKSILMLLHFGKWCRNTSWGEPLNIATHPHYGVGYQCSGGTCYPLTDSSLGCAGYPLGLVGTSHPTGTCGRRCSNNRRAAKPDPRNSEFWFGTLEDRGNEIILLERISIANYGFNDTEPSDSVARKLCSFLKNTVFWDVALCTSCVNQRFGGTYRLHLQGRKIRE